MVHVAPVKFSAADSERAPVELRKLIGEFAEKGWSFDLATKAYPDGTKEGLLGSAAAKPGEPDSEFKIVMSLAGTDSPFPAALLAAMVMEKPALLVALCSKLSPEDVEGALYKVYSKDGPAEKRPMLKIVLERMP
jgi:hypothetical protein